MQLEGNDTMARSYVIDECQADLNKSVKISRTPGQCPGAEMHFPDLLEEQVMKHVSDKIQINLLLKGAIKYLLHPHLTLRAQRKCCRIARGKWNDLSC